MTITVSIPEAIADTPPAHVTRFQKNAASNAGASEAPIIVYDISAISRMVSNWLIIR